MLTNDKNVRPKKPFDKRFYVSGVFRNFFQVGGTKF